MGVSITKQGVVKASAFSETFVNPLDTHFYEELDKSIWIRLVHHNNPTDLKFASSNTFTSSVYIDENRWFYVSIVNAITNNTYEFMIKQKPLSTDTESKYRWIQTVNPFTAVFEDVDAADVTKITTTGYSNHSSYGGIYKFGSNTYFVANNSNKGNWWGALGCWTAISGGIPGYGGAIIKTGYIDLYLRIDNQTNNIASIFKNSIKSSEFIEI
jgi:hypothetical protein